MKAKPTFSLKDQLFNPEKVDYLATLITDAQPTFPKEAFCKTVIEAFPTLELKARIDHITTCLQTHLPADYLAALDIILGALPPKLDLKRSALLAAGGIDKTDIRSRLRLRLRGRRQQAGQPQDGKP